MTNSFEGKQFQSAAYRRKGVPITFQWQHWPTNDDGEAENEPVEVTLAIDPNADAVRMGAAFGGFAQTLQEFGKPDSDMEALAEALDKAMPRVKSALRDLLTPPSRLKWDTITDSVDLTGLSQIIRWVMAEMSGLDPTQPESSLNGSLPTGSDLTASVLPAELTPPAFPSEDASTST